eukprot:10040995-Ditylum_brightwellii.AAC.1
MAPSSYIPSSMIFLPSFFRAWRKYLMMQSSVLLALERNHQSFLDLASMMFKEQLKPWHDVIPKNVMSMCKMFPLSSWIVSM